jgi:hypothetical protein
VLEHLYDADKVLATNPASFKGKWTGVGITFPMYLISRTVLGFLKVTGIIIMKAS